METQYLQNEDRFHTPIFDEVNSPAIEASLYNQEEITENLSNLKFDKLIIHEHNSSSNINISVSLK